MPLIKDGGLQMYKPESGFRLVRGKGNNEKLKITITAKLEEL